MRRVRVSLGRSSYNIIIGEGLLVALGDRLRKLGHRDRLVIITSPAIKALHGDAVAVRLAGDGFSVTTLAVPDGEEHKTLEAAGRLYHELSDAQAERTTPIVALGGGVIGDLAGFVAATYLRGVPLVQAPTTLLAQVDSSIGGKTGVDHGELKNQVGVFYQPELVVSDTSVLATLPPAEIRCGLAEVIKCAIIRDRAFFAYIESSIEQIVALDRRALEECVFRSARIKAAVVSRDERDSGLRNILNFGHTVGHAVETVSGFKVKHGEAVAIGMATAARISVRLGLLRKAEQERISGIIHGAGLPTSMPELDPDRLIEAMGHDKKIVDGKLRFVLPRTIGRVVVSDKVPETLVREVLASGE